MIIVTGATGQLGRLVIESLLRTEPADTIVAAVREPAKAADLAALGVQVRHADYAKPQTLDAAFSGGDKLLLISSNALGERVAQHGAVIDAATRAGVQLIAYTSVLYADTSPLELAKEHLETELLIKRSGVAFTLLRNGWYNENYVPAMQQAVSHGKLFGSAGEGRISSAARADYAEAAAVLLAQEGHAGHIYELAGDTGYTFAELANDIARQSGKAVEYVDLPEAEYKAILVAAGMPEVLANVIADSSVGISKGALFDESRTLGKLIGHPTKPITQTVAAAINA